ncbi:pyruvate formate lyase 1-activating protein [Thalassotalea maritima]|uniref:pyruvate formate lyase 1-activating protein n=1 Tax=Thalassotalea maritima TaxID=3242416 RepID=UPI00352902D8
MSELLGRIHSVETCGAFDGPGLRFIIFMQGCLMRCKYCHNRDSWDEDIGQQLTVEQLMAQIRTYKQFFKFSGGGVSVSGGEPVLQAPFVTELFKACKAEGIHTCLDTNGFVRNHNQTIDDLLAVTDLVLLDLKQMNREIHRDLTKVSNRYAIAFAQHLAQINKPTWIRYVIVPGYSDDEASAKLLAEFIAPMPNIERLELLPYHDTGSYKWLQYNDTYELADTKPPSQESLDNLAQLFQSYNLTVVI